MYAYIVISKIGYNTVITKHFQLVNSGEVLKMMEKCV